MESPARPPPERATARYAFKPLRAHQLELRANDNLEVWVTDESWWLARNQRGEEGRVPSGHVQLGAWNEDGSDADMADDAPTARAMAPSPDDEEPTGGHDKKIYECHSEPWDQTLAQRPPSPEPAALSHNRDPAKERYNKTKSAARRLLLFYYATDTEQRIEWDKTRTYDSHRTQEKDTFYALAKEKTTLKDIIECGLDVCRNETGNWGSS